MKRISSIASGGGSAQVPGSTGATANAVGLQAAGFIPAGNIGTNASGTALTQNLEFAINDNNAAGVTGSTANAADALAVTTGMEFSIALADLGNPGPGSVIKIAAMINNGDHNYRVESDSRSAGRRAGQPGRRWQRWFHRYRSAA